MSKILCIYHGGCDDGFAAAWAVRRALGEDRVEFHAGVYQVEPPDVGGREVLLVDFSYKRPVLERMIAVADTLTVLDHHRTAEADLAGLNNSRPGVKVIFDMERSGAGLAWDYFHPGKPRPELIDLVEDRDLWRFHRPQTKAFSAALRSYPQDFETWDRLADSVPQLVLEGVAIQRFYEQKIAEAKKFVFRLKIRGHDVPVCNAPYFMASDLAGELAAGEPFAATYFATADSVSFSLRSRAPDGIDVSEIAQTFGGGGHKHAAGFRLPKIDKFELG